MIGWAILGKLPWKWIGAALAVLGVLWAFAGWNYHRGVAHEQAAQAARVEAARKAVVKTEAKADAITADVGQKAEVKQAEIRTVTRTIIEKVPVYVTPKADAQCVVTRGFVRLHDAAAAGRLPEVANGPDDADSPAGIPLSTAASTVAANYGQCLQWRSIAEGWQDWNARQAANR